MAHPLTVAHHEAGHAVAAILSGQRLRGVALEADGSGWCDTAGHAAKASPGSAPPEALLLRAPLGVRGVEMEVRLLRAMRGVLAGVAAEDVFLGGHADFSAAGKDVDVATRMARLGWGRARADAVVGEQAVEARRWMQREWRAVRRVAWALAREGYLSDRDVRRLVAGLSI